MPTQDELKAQLTAAIQSQKAAQEAAKRTARARRAGLSDETVVSRE